ncbi:MAG: SDR family NAD(P)-dependent oxidoreductase [Candidatus Sericytochromatia bacterium]
MKALITGGSRGIGLACAKALAARGIDTWIGARDAGGLEAARQAATEQGLMLHTVQLDVSHPDSVAQAFAQVGALEILVHAAGMEAFSQLDNLEDPALWRQVMATNLDGAYYCSRAALAQMPDQTGRLVLIASVLGLRGMRNSHAYCAAKHGVIGLVRALAQDVSERGITVNAVCPGWVRTEMAERSLATIAAHYGLEAQAFTEAELQAVPIGRWIEPAEVATLVCSLIDSPALTGQAIEISGGL